MTQFIKKNDENMFNVFEENANIEIYEKSSLKFMKNLALGI